MFIGSGENFYMRLHLNWTEKRTGLFLKNRPRPLPWTNLNQLHIYIYYIYIFCVYSGYLGLGWQLTRFHLLFSFHRLYASNLHIFEPSLKGEVWEVWESSFSHNHTHLGGCYICPLAPLYWEPSDRTNTADGLVLSAPEQRAADCQSASLLLCSSSLIGGLSCGGSGERLSERLRLPSIQAAGGSGLPRSGWHGASTDSGDVSGERTSDPSSLKTGHRSAKRIVLLWPIGEAQLNELRLDFSFKGIRTSAGVSLLSGQPGQDL